MKATSLGVLALLFCIGPTVSGGSWTDHFSEGKLGPDWQGTRDFFTVTNGVLKGVSVSPLAPAPFHYVEVGKGWDNFVVECQINVVMPNLLVCSKGALLLRHTGDQGYVFAIHTATKKIEVYRLNSEELLLEKDAPLEFKRWYSLRAELQGPKMTFYVDGELIGTVTDSRSLSGSVGVVAQDVAETQFDDFIVRGPNIPSNGIEATLGKNGVTLSWPGSLTNYVLQSASALTTSSVWSRVTNAPVEVGDRKSVTLLPAVTTYYRLQTQ
jgi:hypothetical protein